MSPLTKKLLLPLAFTLTLLCSATLHAQTAPDLTGTWQGTLQAGKALRLVFKIAKADTGYKATLYSIDQQAPPIKATGVSVEGATVKISLGQMAASYTGKLSPDNKAMTGTWTQGGADLPLNLASVSEANSWSIPEPPAAIPPMPRDAKPVLEIATIKPSKPDQQGKGFTLKGRNIITINTSVDDMITFAYAVHAKQVSGGPDWAATQKFDIEGQPDIVGMPNETQYREMLQRLLTDRFKLTFHREQKEMPVYALTVAKGGPKLTKSESDSELPGLGFRALGKLFVVNATMRNFTNLMQTAVMDRPVVDQTGLTGRWNFNLNWTPDESQFGGMGLKVPPPSDAADAPPNLFTAIQEQIGLKLDAVKAPVEVLVIDHLEKPSDN